LLAAILALAGHLGPSERAHARAIYRATREPVERAVLVVIAWSETRFARRGHDGTPAFGVTDWVRVHHGRRPSIRRAARISVHALRYIRSHRCPGAAWDVVLGRYHHGLGLRDGGCYADSLSTRQAEMLRRIDLFTDARRRR
jgi:hypothetical protein